MSAATSRGVDPPSLPAESTPLARLRAARGDRLRVRVVETGGRTLLRISGPVNAATAPALEAALRPYRPHGPCLILDLQGVEYIETPGLRLLLSLAEELPARGGRLCLVVPPQSRVERTLHLVGLDRRCPVFPTARAAWTAPSPPCSAPTGERGDDHDTR